MGWKELLPACSQGAAQPHHAPQDPGGILLPTSILAPKYPSPQMHTLAEPEMGANVEHKTKSLQSQLQSQEPKLLTGPSCWGHFFPPLLGKQTYVLQLFPMLTK